MLAVAHKQRGRVRPEAGAAAVGTGEGRPPRDDGLRRCIVSGDSLPRAEMLRFVIGPDDVVVPDMAGRLPGRGLWLRARRDIVVQACTRSQFTRAARHKVTPMAGCRLCRAGY